MGPSPNSSKFNFGASIKMSRSRIRKKQKQSLEQKTSIKTNSLNVMNKENTSGNENKNLLARIKKSSHSLKVTTMTSGSESIQYLNQDQKVPETVSTQVLDQFMESFGSMKAGTAKPVVSGMSVMPVVALESEEHVTVGSVEPGVPVGSVEQGVPVGPAEQGLPVGPLATQFWFS